MYLKHTFYYWKKHIGMYGSILFTIMLGMIAIIISTFLVRSQVVTKLETTLNNGGFYDLAIYNIPEEVKNMGVGKKYYVRTFGCQANERDGETLIGILEALGYEPADAMDQAQIVILNTCAIRENAVERAFGELGHLKSQKREHEDVIIAICGCMVQQETVVERIYKKHPEVDLVFGTHNIHQLPSLLKTVVIQQQRVIEVFSYEGEVIENMPVHRLDSLKAWVNIVSSKY